MSVQPRDGRGQLFGKPPGSTRADAKERDVIVPRVVVRPCACVRFSRGSYREGVQRCLGCGHAAVEHRLPERQLSGAWTWVPCAARVAGPR